MEDFIFGTLSTDRLKLNYHRTSKLGIKHGYNINPKDPLPGQPVILGVETGPDVYIDQMACYYTNDGSQPIGSRGEAIVGSVVFFKRKFVEWDTLTWGYRTYWEAQIPEQPDDGEIRYVISAWSDDGQELFADWPDVKLTIERFAKYYFDGQPIPELEPLGDKNQATIFSYHVDRFSPPQWLRECVIYHIFVDRFFPGNGADWEQTKNLSAPFGGTLWGVAEKLDYFHELGVTALWLSPIFPSPTIHRYDATDYFHVADSLGGDGALHELVEQAHKRGIRIILDLVCNHISNQHPFFKHALENSDSQYRDWFYFSDDEETGYRTFFGVESMPQVNLNHEGAREWMLDIARYWLEEFEVDGYRLDHATGPGPGFWDSFWKVCKETKADSVCLGEIVEPPDVQLQYFGKMDGLLDFHLCEAFRRRFALDQWTKERFLGFIRQHNTFFPKGFVMPSFLDNHDMDRFMFIAIGGEEALENAAIMQFQLPGPPIIYYGTEVGLAQKVSKTTEIGLEASRGAMVWGNDQDKRILEFYKNLIKARSNQGPWI